MVDVLSQLADSSSEPIRKGEINAVININVH
jgi:hypothetical protein